MASRSPRGPIIAERDPLTDGLGWDGLIAVESFGLPRKPGDAVLLWQGDRPLVLRRGPQLLVAFDVTRSNAARLPAFVLLLNRFLEGVRGRLPIAETGNFETNQPLQVASAGGSLRLHLRGTQDSMAAGVSPLRAPVEPGFFTVTEEGARGGTRLTGAAHFADPREADFHDAASLDEVSRAAVAQRERHSEEDLWTPAWVLLLGGVMAANWLRCGRET